MTFDPTSVDLSFVEPALRAEVLRRIEVIEEFSRSRGPAARSKAREALGVNDHQIYLLSRAWTARRRAEDITTRATRRSRPSSLSPELLAMIDKVADQKPSASIVEIAAEVEQLAADAGLSPPSYPTVNKYVRERKAATRRATLGAMGNDLLIDVTVVDIPVDSEGERIRPQFVVVADGPGARLVGLSGTTGMLSAAEVARALVTVVAGDLELLGVDSDRHDPSPVSISMPYMLAPGWDRLSVALRDAGAELALHELKASTCGAVAATLFGTTWGGYKLRPRLVGRKPDRRPAPDLKRAAVPIEEAVDYLGAVATERNTRSVSPIGRLGRDALHQLSKALEAITGSAV